MILLDSKPTAVPPLYHGPTVHAGTVYVARRENGALKPQLPDGVKAVLATSKGERELLTVAEVPGTVSVEGTFLHKTDLDAFASVENPTLRRYRAGDVRSKLFTRRGVVITLTSIVGALAALAALYFAVLGKSPTTSVQVADGAQALVLWTAEPAGRLSVGATAGELSLAREAVRRRSVSAVECLTGLRGGAVTVAEVAGVNCEPAELAWWESKETGTFVALVSGCIIALLGLGGLERLGFGRSAADS